MVKQLKNLEMYEKEVVNNSEKHLFNKQSNLKLKALFEKEIQEIYNTIFIPALEDIQNYKQEIQQDILKNKFNTSKILIQQLEMVDKFLEEFTKSKYINKINKLLQNMQDELKIVIDNFSENNATDNAAELEKIMQLILDIYLDMQQVKTKLIKDIASLN